MNFIFEIHQIQQLNQKKGIFKRFEFMKNYFLNYKFAMETFQQNLMRISTNFLL